MSNGMLSMCDGTVKVIANLFVYDDQMKFDAEKKKADIEAYGLTSKEKIMEFEGFLESDYDDYNLQYLNVAIGKGLTTWEWIEAFSDYCVENGLVDIYGGLETAKENEAPKMLMMYVSAPKKMLAGAPEPPTQGGVEITADTQGKYIFEMPAQNVVVTAEFEEVHTHDPVKVAGQAATEQAAGFKSYYKCDCGKFFEDAEGTAEITDLAKWKAEGGNGYLPKLEPEPQFGDTSNLTLWVTMLALSATGLCACLIPGKKRKNER